MLRTNARRVKAPVFSGRLEHAEHISVGPVSLLGVQVTARVVLNRTEHERRDVVGLGPVTDQTLLDRLIELKPNESVIDSVFWAETSELPRGIVARGDDGYAVTRLLEQPLCLSDLLVQGTYGRELLAVQNASMFAGFAARWVSVGRSDIRDVVVMEAKLCGVGLLGPDYSVLLQAEQPEVLVADGWSWLMCEKIYRRWLKGQTPAHAMESPVPTTGEASATAES